MPVLDSAMHTRGLATLATIKNSQALSLHVGPLRTLVTQEADDDFRVFPADFTFSNPLALPPISAPPVRVPGDAQQPSNRVPGVISPPRPRPTPTIYPPSVHEPTVPNLATMSQPEHGNENDRLPNGIAPVKPFGEVRFMFTVNTLFCNSAPAERWQRDCILKVDMAVG